MRSFELGIIAYESGFLDKYMLKEEEKLKEIENINKSVLEGVLWAIKLAGCSVRGEDIDEVLHLEIKINS